MSATDERIRIGQLGFIFRVWSLMLSLTFVSGVVASLVNGAPIAGILFWTVLGSPLLWIARRLWAVRAEFGESGLEIRNVWSTTRIPRAELYNATLYLPIVRRLSFRAAHRATLELRDRSRHRVTAISVPTSLIGRATALGDLEQLLDSKGIRLDRSEPFPRRGRRHSMRPQRSPRARHR